MNKPLGQDFPDTEPLSLGEELSLANHEPAKPRSAAPLKVPAAAIPDILGLELAPVGGGEDELLAETRKDGRVCPQPTRWLEFYRVLQDAGKAAALPAPPLTGSAWAANTPAAKRACFQAQVTWAVQNGCIAPAYGFLSGLPKSDWYHGN